MSNDSDYFIDDHGTRRYASGNGLGKHPGSAAERPIALEEHAITHETSPKFLERRVELGREAAEKGIIEGTKAQTGAEAVQIIVREQTKLALNTDKGRGSTEAAKWVTGVSGYVQDRKAGSMQQMAIQILVTPGIQEQSETLVMLDDNGDE